MTSRPRRTPAGEPGAAPKPARAKSAAPGTRKALVESQIIAAATELFAARGFAGTSLQDIAEAAGLTRPALYHYFASKEELLSRLVSEVTVGPAAELRRIRRRAGTSVHDRLYEMASAIASLQARAPARFRTLIRSEADLPEALAATYDAGRRSVLREFSSLIDEGVQSGEFRPVDPRTAALGVIGLCNWVAWWHRPGDEADDRRIVGELAEMAVASVAATDPVASDDRAAPTGGVERVVELLKRDVAALERVVRPSRPAH